HRVAPSRPLSSRRSSATARLARPRRAPGNRPANVPAESSGPVPAMPRSTSDGRVPSTTATYAELSRRAEVLLSLGETVVLDASWSAARHCRLAADAAERASSPVLAVRCEVPETVAAQRITTRIPDLSDATPQLARRMTADAEPWPEAHSLTTTVTPRESILRAVLSLLPEHRKSSAQRHSGPPGDPAGSAR